MPSALSWAVTALNTAVCRVGLKAAVSLEAKMVFLEKHTVMPSRLSAKASCAVAPKLRRAVRANRVRVRVMGILVRGPAEAGQGVRRTGGRGWWLPHSVAGLGGR